MVEIHNGDFLHSKAETSVSGLLDVYIHFVDTNKIELGQGVAVVYFSNGKIKYEGYDIHEYTNRYPAIGKHYTIHEESYAEALEIVKNVLHEFLYLEAIIDPHHFMRNYLFKVLKTMPLFNTNVISRLPVTPHVLKRLGG